MLLDGPLRSCALNEFYDELEKGGGEPLVGCHIVQLLGFLGNNIGVLD